MAGVGKGGRAGVEVPDEVTKSIQSGLGLSQSLIGPLLAAIGQAGAARGFTPEDINQVQSQRAQLVDDRKALQAQLSDAQKQPTAAGPSVVTRDTQIQFQTGDNANTSINIPKGTPLDEARQMAVNAGVPPHVIESQLGSAVASPTDAPHIKELQDRLSQMDRDVASFDSRLDIMSQAGPPISLESAQRDLDIVGGTPGTSERSQLDPQGFVANLYQSLLGRAPDSADQAAWERHLAKVGPDQLISDFINEANKEKPLDASEAKTLAAEARTKATKTIGATPGTTGQLGKLDETADVFQSLATTLAGQVEEGLKTGGVGAQMPIINKAVEASRQAGSNTLRTLDENLARTGMAGTPFGARTRAGAVQAGELATSRVPTNIVQEFLKTMTPQATGALEGAGRVRGAGAMARTALAGQKGNLATTEQALRLTPLQVIGQLVGAGSGLGNVFANLAGPGTSAAIGEGQVQASQRNAEVAAFAQMVSALLGASGSAGGSIGAAAVT